MAKTGGVLTEREELFCWHYAVTQNAREAAARAGYGGLFAEKTAARLLRNEMIAARIQSLCGEQKKRAKSVRVGLERLAFGSIADAVELLCSDEYTASDIQRLDLFCISEIKRPKGGGFEIKFFDRLKALERLAEMDDKFADEGALPFYRAIEQGALALREESGGDGDE